MRAVHILLSLATVSLAAPANYFDGVYEFSEELADFYGKVSMYINGAKQSTSPSATCDSSKIALPSYASEWHPDQDGVSPMYVALGRGTQNYSCADSTSQSKPVLVGAVANLYNATCLAADFPDLVHLLPDIAYKITLPTDNRAAFPPANLGLMGHHYFVGSVPTFNLDTTPTKQFGIARTKKEDSIKAPANAVKGEHGAVAWLYLSTIENTVGDYKRVYRVDTASGNAPSTCEGLPAAFEIQYSANYYFFGK
ncbi:Uncharacterized protein PECH_003999 [Penicillium ucsense]|uniref:Uncharacterized protein n=1 Tax=Penicillium ucsense TaxID=2839758 RepID=A0A8J8W3W0_9EURO|nr:Uncharacterized protein PECM_004680 [Penicillium ucsense]KAF7737305.1 Uncharacterized protein PECH_003999 [Penicillium ucsense]